MTRTGIEEFCQTLGRVLEESGVTVGGELDPTRVLITSGMVDSIALFNLANWIEKQIDGHLDLTSVNITVDWDTPERIAAFITSRRSAHGDWSSVT
jgi:hypothetical protein